MRIISLSDLHGSFAGLELLLELTGADMYLIAGDLLYNPYRNLADIEEFFAVQMEVRSWLPRDRKVAAPLQLRALRPQVTAEKRNTIDRYLELSGKARRAMHRQYRNLEQLRSHKPRATVFFLPGNYDLDLSETALAGVNLHRRSFRTPAGRVGGFGGAPVFTPGVPQHLAIPFHEDTEGPGASSDPRDVLKGLDPDIAVTHVPPLAVLDGSPSRRYGSWGIRQFVEESPRLRLLICGHVHESWGVKLLNNCWVVNSGNFGSVAETDGYRKGHYFAEIDFEPGEEVRSVIFKRIEHSRIWHIVEYHRQAQTIKSDVVDTRRYDDWRLHPVLRDERTDLTDHDLFNVGELQAYNQIKLFLRRFETAESEHRVEDLREYIQLTRKQGTEIAFDILGSLNFGQSVAQSDVDAVLYIEDDPANNRYNPGFWTGLADQVSGGRYLIEFTDIIDLWRVREAIAREDADDEDLQRFVIYRTIGRPINVRLLRTYDELLNDNDSLRRTIQRLLRDDLRVLAGTFRHVKSFDKYLERLREQGTRIPISLQRRIHRYLHTLM